MRGRRNRRNGRNLPRGRWRSAAALLPKGWPWWRAPSFPAQVEVELLGDLEAGPADETAAERTARVAERLRAALAPA